MESSSAAAPPRIVAAPAAPGAAVWAVAEWALLAAAVGLWAGSRSYSPWMNLGSGLVAASWLARRLRLGRLTRPTPLDWPIVLFLVSAVLGVVVAPDLGLALARLYLFLAAVALFYGAVNAGPGGLRLFAYAFIWGAAALGIYFASQHNWAAQPAKFAAVGALGLRLNQFVPDLGLYKPHPNVVGAILAVAGPVALACFGGDVGRWRRGPGPARLLGLAVSGLGGLLVLLGLVATESRTAWLAVAVAVALGGWWVLAAPLARGLRAGAGQVFWLGVAGAAVVVLAAVAARPALLTSVFGSLPGPNSVVSRVEIFGQVWRLAQDTPFTGGGLDAFPGLYSTYILGIPFLFLTHAHNAYLNVLVEHGWLGLAGYSAMLGVGAWAAARQLRRADAGLRWAAAAGGLGLAVVLVHGLGEGSLVASRAIPVLLIPAGLALARLEAAPPQAQAGRGAGGRGLPLAAAGAALALLAGGLVFWRPLAAAWHANLGALAFQRVDLAGWPTDEWDDGRRAAAYGPAEAELKNAVELQPGNRTANQRLGLAALSRRDFASAADYLATAYQADPGHRGVIKALALAYVWLGNYEAAAPLAGGLPEVPSELTVYTWWWGTQGRPDLAKRAAEMADWLAS